MSFPPRPSSIARAYRFRLSVPGLALLLWVSAALAVPLAAADPSTSCASDRIDERAVVAFVYDGDTVALQDGRKVRLIGINTPELAHEQNPEEPYAAAARDALRALLEPLHTIGLRFDEEHADRYGRLLAHVYTAAGDSVECRLLEQGYGAAIVVPPNTWNMDCYWQAEGRARAAGLGIWALPYSRPIETTRLAPQTRGFHWITGRVRHVGESRRSLWLDLEGGVALRVAKEDLPYFGELAPERLLHRQVVARGWLIPRRRGPVMQLRHPLALQLVDEASAAGARQ